MDFRFFLRRADPGPRALYTSALLVLLCSAMSAGAADPHGAGVDGAPLETPVEIKTRTGHGFWTKTLWYLPNRVLDLLDMARLRVKVGPGLEAGVRVTDVTALYAGHSQSVYAGLPGPRGKRRTPALAGFDQRSGLVVLGVDATDTFPHPPQYGFSEIGANVHLLVVGVDAGVSPAEIGDFVWGLLGRDPRGDDLPRPRDPGAPRPGPVLEHRMINPEFELDPRPERFPNLVERLEYLRENVPRRMRGQLQSVDHFFLNEDQLVVPQPPVGEMELALHVQYLSDPGQAFELKPAFDFSADLPNLERELELVIRSSDDDDLPGVDEVDRQDRGWTFALRKQLDRIDISADVGIHSGWPPELFSKVYWDPRWRWGDWNWRFEHRFFWENEDGFGFLSSISAFHWLGTGQRWQIRTLTAGRMSESTEGYEWQQSLLLGHMGRLRDESRRLENVGIGDTINCLAWKASLFGHDRDQTEYRATMVYRRDLYDEFILLEVEPGLQWRREYDWEAQFRLEAGLIMVF